MISNLRTTAVVVLITISFMFRSSAGSSPGEAVVLLEKWLQIPREERTPLQAQQFATLPLTAAQAELAAQLLWQDHTAHIRATRRAEMAEKVIELDELRMRFETVSFGGIKAGDKAARSLFISMHGGGGTRPEVNESQWRNQIRLGNSYAPAEGIYLAPRAPTDTWNLWHQHHIDRFFSRLIENLVALENINPNRVFLMGYSAGGDGVYQLAPRMADRFAAAAMMAGHPNDASPLGLRNLPFSIQMGERDSAYSRNSVAAEWGRKLEELQRGDPDGYIHLTQIHSGKGHWMELADRAAIPWMEQFERNPLPGRVVWKQASVIHHSFYWLAVPPGTACPGQEIIAKRFGQTITLQSSNTEKITVRLSDAMLQLDKPVTIQANGRQVFSGPVERSIAVLFNTLSEKGDPALVFSAELTVEIPDTGESASK
jgi:predicted esterase